MAIRAHVTRRRGKGKTPQTLNRDRVALMGLLNQAVQDGIIEANPLAKWRPLKTENDTRVRWLGQRDKDEDIKDSDGNKLSERHRFMEALTKQDDLIRTLVEVAMNTGLRRGELFGLTWGGSRLEGRPADRCSRHVEDPDNAAHPAQC